jgi:two-component system chemotaxis sensor kinase CheA
LSPLADAPAGIDLSQYHLGFFEEAGENLQHMERQLLEIDLDSADDETLNSIFRCAHSVKGGAATFGFADVAELTHLMEALLDKLRRRELAATAAMVGLLLQCGDALRAQLQRHRSGGSDALPDCAALQRDMLALLDGRATAPAAAASASLRTLELCVGPLPQPQQLDALLEFFVELPELGHIEALDAGTPRDGRHRFKLTTTSSDAELLDLFNFHVDRDRVRLSPFDGNPGMPAQALAVAAADTAGAGSTRKAASAGLAPAEATTLRVSIEKIDQLLNLAGELVITQAMLAQASTGSTAATHPHLANALADLERHTRDLQQSVMAIRMIPMSNVFSRFPRLLRDLSARLGKKIECVMSGEATELDKGMVEKISDPLTHLVRNACDHGIELPSVRVAQGKPETGTVTLRATHQGGSMLIEVRDDGQGLSRDKLLRKARERGIDAPDSLNDAQVWDLIFAPGFTTAEQVTDVSGRGVGMDVVKRNIAELGGTVQIDSVAGQGMLVAVRLPLTLAIMEAMILGVGGERYILPMACMVEAFHAQPAQITSLGGRERVLRLHDVYLPLLDLRSLLDVPTCGAPTDAQASRGDMIVVVDCAGERIALQVDELLGQQQVVVKNLDAEYRVPGHLGGATLMGDGRVALILDLASLLRRSRR